MYVWRGENRRDRRQFLLGGAAFWGPPIGSKES